MSFGVSYLHSWLICHGRVRGVDYLQSVILGIVEGLTEFLPVSSTGHLELARHLMGLDASAFSKSFEIFIQLGAILAVVVLYGKRLAKDLEVWKRIIAAFVPTGLIGLLLYKVIKNSLLGNIHLVVAMLVGVGLLLVFADRVTKGRERYQDVDQMPLSKAFLVGLIQAVSVVPGVSRSGASILGGMFLGLSAKAAAEFSFLLAVPTMLATSGFELFKNGTGFSGGEWGLLAVGFMVSFVVAMASIRFMIGLLPRYGFMPFGIYRVAAGLIYALVFLR